MPNLDRFNDSAFRYQDRRGKEEWQDRYGEDCKRCVVCERLIKTGNMCASCKADSGEEDGDEEDL